jgi:PAS domain S-box-containing protein
VGRECEEFAAFWNNVVGVKKEFALKSGLQQKGLTLLLAPVLLNALLMCCLFAAHGGSTAEAATVAGLGLQTVISLGLLLNLVLAVAIVFLFNKTFGGAWQRLVTSSDALISRSARDENKTESDDLTHLESNVRKMASLLEEAREKESAILGYASDVICTFDLSGKCMSMNPASSRLWGYEPKELLDTDIYSLIAPGDRPRFGGHINSVHHKSIPGEYELQVTRKDGTLADTLWSLYWSTENSWIVAVVHDITARKIHERLQAEFTAMVSHDLRSPLATVQMFLQNLSNGFWGELPSQLSQGGLQAKRLLDKLIALVDDILDYEKLAAGEVSVEMTELSLASVIEDSIHAVSGMATQSNVTVTPPAVPSQAVVRGDQNRLSRVLINILSNAIKYSPAGETVTIVVSEDDGEVVLQIRDRGPGIKDADKSMVFEKFKQSLSNPVKPGTGLGLAICKNIIEQHGGRIGISDPPAGAPGTIFWFKLPKKQRA